MVTVILEKSISRITTEVVTELKAGFHKIANDRRRPRIADDRKESCFHIIADDHKRSHSQLSHTFRSAEMSNVLARCARGKIEANNMADIFLLLVLKRRQRQLQNRRKHLFWIRKISMKRQEKLTFSPIFS